MGLRIGNNLLKGKTMPMRETNIFIMPGSERPFEWYHGAILDKNILRIYYMIINISVRGVEYVSICKRLL